MGRVSVFYYIYRDSVTGKFVTIDYALSHPDTTQSIRRRRKKKSQTAE